MKRNHLGQLVIHALGLALLIYTGARTVDFIALTLPPAQQALAYIGLAAFDVGLIGWTVYYLTAARGGWQRAIALVMILVSLLGVVTAFIGDTLYRSAERGTVAAVDPQLTVIVVYTMAAVIAANIAALIGLHLADPAAQRRAAEQDAQDAIEEETTAHIGQQAASLAAQIAPARASAWAAETAGRFALASHATTGEPAPALLHTAVLNAPNGTHRGPSAQTAPKAAKE